MKRFFFALIIGLLVLSCSDISVVPNNPPNLRALSSTEITVATSLNDFGFRLLREVDADQNMFISPLSVSIALGMVMNGATDETTQSIINTIKFDGLTADEINQAYKDLAELLTSTDKTVSMGIANSAWYHQDYAVNTGFAKTMKDYYNGTAQSLDFSSPSAKNTINGWVEDKTNNRIQNLIQDISPDEVMFLVNAIYFKGDWQYQFDASRTHVANFTRKDGSTTPVSMMFSKGTKILYETNEKIQLVDIPYGNGQFRMTILIPTTGSLHNLVESITAEQLNTWLVESDSASVELEIPKFRMTWKNDLKNTLVNMGMQMKGFPKLFEQPMNLAISRVVHQSFLDVNEKGSEAAAATAIGIEFTSAPSKPTRITIDKSFLFFIRENHSGVILFSGQLVDPTRLGTD
jgi:serine protease inhibitor